MGIPLRKKRKVGRQRSLNGLVYGLLVLAVFLGVLAAWQRYSQRTSTDQFDVAESQVQNALAKLGIPEGWSPVGGLQAAATAPNCRFACTSCQAMCRTPVDRGCPACPFCGRPMARQGGGMTTVAATGNQVGTAPVAIQAGTPRPHGARGPCTNCHTVLSSPSGGLGGGGGLGNVIDAPADPQPGWQDVAAPAEAVKPTLIKEFGMAVCPAQGAGVKVSGVMGNSHAATGGVTAGDVITACNGSPVSSVEQLQQLVAQTTPELDARLTIARNGRSRETSIMVGEGEMAGFVPLGQP